MLYSEHLERARRFRLALRMGLPILLLVAAALFALLQKSRYTITTADIFVTSLILFISVYFLFFLINTGQSESFIDRLSGSFNRRALFSVLAKEMKKSPEYTILLLKIDNLPFINDHFGIDRGDQFIRTFVHIFDDYLRIKGIKEAVIGRYHGGDFIVGLPLDLQNAKKTVENFLSTYRQIEEIPLEMRFSEVEKSQAKDLEVVVTYLYDSLSESVHNGTKKENGEKRIDLSQRDSEIVEAIEAGRLLLHFVPIWHREKEAVDLFEVGVRLQTDQSGILPPKKFIPVVNRLGLEKRFDLRLCQILCDLASQIDEIYRFSFNISPFSLRNDAFVTALREMLAEKGIYRKRFILELYENRPYKEIDRYRLLLEDLKNAGFCFALDNFGASNAGFEYVKKLPVDMVQFDREFTISYDNPKTAALFKGYLQAFKAMDVATMVKWVDTPEAFERFRQLGVDYIQGFVIANRPLDREELIKQYGVKR